jgi:hypothetical protein
VAAVVVVVLLRRKKIGRQDVAEDGLGGRRGDYGCTVGGPTGCVSTVEARKGTGRMRVDSIGSPLNRPERRAGMEGRGLPSLRLVQLGGGNKGYIR